MSEIGSAVPVNSGRNTATDSADVHGQLARSAAAALEQLCASFVATAGELEQARDAASVERLRELRLQIAEALTGLTGPVAPPLAQALNAVTQSCLKSAIRGLSRSPQEEALFARCRDPLAASPQGDPVAVGLAALLLAWHACELETVPPLAAVPSEIRPSWLAFMLELPPSFAHRGDGDRFVHYLQRLCDWLLQYVEATRDSVEDIAIAFFGSAIFMQGYFNELNLRDVMSARGALVEHFLERGGAFLDQLRPMRPVKTRPRIGFIAYHITDGTETAALAAHLERLDRRRFDVRLYSIGRPSGTMAAVCRAAAEAYVQLPTQLADAVARLRCEGLDIALFCTNLTAIPHPLTLIAAHRVAPVQVTTGASPVTTGLRSVDIMISGVPNETEGAEAHYTERLMLMPHAINCYAFNHLFGDRPKPDQVSRSTHGIPERAVLFFSAANFYKIQPELSELWFRILSEVPDSYLLLMPFNPNWSNNYQVVSFNERLRRQMSEMGVAASRVIFHPPVPTVANLHRLIELADVYLDAFPFSGACSIYDVLQVAVPLVARAGSVCRARHSTAILQEEGLEDWVVSNDRDYVNRAVALARNPDKRAAEQQRAIRARDAGLKLVNTTPFAAMLMPLFDRMISDWNQHVETLRALEPAVMAQRISAAVSEVAPRLKSFRDIDLVAGLALPYLRNGGSRRMIDIGACVGKMSKPFLIEGWQTVMFEPDQRCHADLAKLIEAYPGQARVERAVVTADRDGLLAFHIADTPGLSGLSRSPFATDLAILEMPAFALAPYIVRNGLFDVDFVKIDAEGHDFVILDGIDFGAIAPRLVMVEFSDQFVGQGRDAIEAALRRMRRKGYRACVVCMRALGDVMRHDWRTGLLAIGIDAIPGLTDGEPLFGNVLFFRDDDCAFVPSLCDWLEQFGDRTRRGLSPPR